MLRKLYAIILVLLALLNVFGCGSNHGVNRQTTTPSQIKQFSSDAGLNPVDVALLGLPDVSEDGSRTTSDASLFVSNNQNGELIVPLRQNAVAPFNGVLFNGPAIARVSVEFNAQQQRCLIERNRDLGLVVARYNADVASLRLAMSTQERTANVLISGRDDDIARLNRLLQVQTNASSGPNITEGLIWASGGLLVGVVVVGGLVLIANSRP